MTPLSHRRAAVLGHPIEHSLSPVLHRAAYAEMGFECEYLAIDVMPEQLGAFLAACGDEWIGLSLTMPLKETVIDLLDDVDERARSVRSINTVVFDEGRRRGFNTDIAGIEAILERADLAANCSGHGHWGWCHRAIVGGRPCVARSVGG